MPKVNTKDNNSSNNRANKSVNKLIISATSVSKSHDNFHVLKNINLSVQQGEKIGLVGPNGIGKTTLLKILVGIEKPDSGKINRSKQISIGYIPQEFAGYQNLTVSDFISDFSKNHEVEKVFKKLNLNDSFLSRKISELSGGEKTKIALARIFLSDQDILLLDEPTNNLDTEALLILEDFVRGSDKTFIIISHDREFLNELVSRIFEIDEFERNLHIYEGNFSSYLTVREERIKRQWSVYSDSVQKKEHLMDVVNEKLNRAEEIGNSGKRDNDKMLRNFKIEQGKKAYQKGAMLLKDRLEKMEELNKPKTLLPLELEFEVNERSGDKVFDFKSVVKKFSNHQLGPIDLSIQYGDRILITGKNGTGKTTLLKLMLGKLQPDSGAIVIGTKLSVGYLPQEEDFSMTNSVKEEFLRHINIEEGLARRTLNRFRLTAEDVDKKIGELSSGERSRLILAILMSQNANCLILDEPSNHLDLEILESLEKGLEKFKGTLIVVSHDRYFINRLNFSKIMLLENGLLKMVSSLQ